MNRDQLLERLERERSWDFVVIGGGATGLGIAVDAASRGFRVALLEQADFTKSTSSKSTKLVHGGVRYLAQGDVRLVLEALKERGLMRRGFSVFLLHSRAAKYIMTPSFATSEGWNWGRMGSWIHRRALLRTTPMPGT